MKKTKLFTSIAALALVLGLGACELTSEEETTPEESESATQSSETTGDTTTEGGTTDVEEPVTLPEGSYRLGVADLLNTSNDVSYRYFVTIDNGALTSTSWNEGADVYVEANTDESGYALKYVEGDETLYIGYNGSGTALVSKSEPYYWAYDSENAVFVDTIEETVAKKDADGNITSYEASGRYIGMQEGYEYLRAYATSNLTSDNYYGATLYSEYPGILEAPAVEEPEITPTPAPEVGEYFLGFDVNGTINYINGGLVGDYSYEGSVTTNIGLAVPVTLAAADGDDAYYLTFELDEATYYICIITLDEGYVDLQYTTEANAIYWDETHAAWVNEEDTYFLCYNSSYNCAYASAFADWWGKSPVGKLYDIPEDWEPYVPTAPEGDAYKLGALDSTNYCYCYFSGSTTGSTFLATTTDWDQAVDIYITPVDDDTENTCTLSFIDANGNTKYIYKYVDNQDSANNTSVSINDEPSTWVWSGTNKGFVDQTSSRYLCLYSDGSIRAYAQSNSNAPALPYTTQPADPEKPEVTTSYEQVSSLVDGGQFYAGGYSSNTLYLTNGQVGSYKLTCTADLDSATPFTVTGNDTDGWTLTTSDGKYVYMYLYNGTLEFGLSNASAVPSSGTKTFFWNSTAKTLYTSEVKRTYNGTTYNYSYFEFYQGSVCGYGTNTLNASTSNLAYFYQQVTA